MHLKHPEILWALLLLLIPLIVHLFRLRRFKKEVFTNVRFLKEVEMQTRKSATLKKWLVLLSRMAGLAMLVLAFAQPYLGTSEEQVSNTSYTVYLDNSFSMQLPVQQETLLEYAVNQLLASWPDNIPLKVITNDNTYGPATKNELRDLLLGLKYTTRQLDLNEIILKSGIQTGTAEDTNQKLYLVSDMQSSLSPEAVLAEGLGEIRAIKLPVDQGRNNSLDSLSISESDPENVTARVFLSSSQQEQSSTLPVSVFSGDELLARTTVNLEKENTNIDFTLKKEDLQHARIVISDKGLEYDNQLYFNLPAEQKINIYHIGDSSSTFIKRIYTDDEFNFTSVSPSAIDYTVLEEQNLVILDQMAVLPEILSRSLIDLSKKGSSIVQIPALNENTASYRSLNRSLQIPERDSLINRSAVINRINYDHPLLQKVFNDRVNNFKYPAVNSYYRVRSSVPAILEFSGGLPFLYGANGKYAFSAPLDLNNSDLARSALVVPVFYNLALQSLKTPRPYLIPGTDTEVDLKTSLGKDEIVKVNDDSREFIPRQDNFGSFITLYLDEQWETSGHYRVAKGQEFIGTLSMNYPRKESHLEYLDEDVFPGLTWYDDMGHGLEQVKSENKVNELWKWFVIFALAFFLTEMLILKYFK